MLEARRFNAVAAVMLVQSFDPSSAWFDDFAGFCALFGIAAPRNTMSTAARVAGDLPLIVGWISSASPTVPPQS